MYDGLTPLFDQVSNSDLNTYYKSEKFGCDGPCTTEPVPRDGVTIKRDAYHVPHIYGKTTSDGIWASGWLLAEDRGLLLQQARYASRVAAIDAPGLTALGVLTSLGNFVPSQQTEDTIAKQTQVLKNHGKQGKHVLSDIDTFIDGINAYLQATNSSQAPWTRNDVYAVNALKGQFLGQGGGDEARNSEFLGGLEDANGVQEGHEDLQRRAPVPEQGGSGRRSTRSSPTGRSRSRRPAASCSTTTATSRRRPCSRRWPRRWTRRRSTPRTRCRSTPTSRRPARR